MIIKDIQERIRSLVYFFVFSLSILISIIITNIQGNQFLYIFLIISLFLGNILVYQKRYIYILLTILLGIMIWYLISINNQFKIDSNYSLLQNKTDNHNSKVYINWIIIDKYWQWDFNKTYVVKILKINGEAIIWNINILWKINNKIFITNWDFINFNSKLEKVDNFNQFDYEKYLLTKDIYAQANIYNLNKDLNRANYIFKNISTLRNKLLDTIDSIYPWDSAKLLGWILLWQKWDFSNELKNSINNSWLSHITAVSGFNITILIIFFNIIFSFFSNKIKMLIISAFVILFILLVWNNLPAIRAWIMWVICYIALNYWRRVNIYSIIIFTTLTLTIINPLIINYDIWFQLSLLALLWLIVIWGRISVGLKFITNRFKIRESISSTVSVLIFTLPIMIYNFWKISLIAVVSNLIVLPIIPFVMLFWWVSIITFLINKTIAIYIWYLAYIWLSLVIKISWFLWNLKYASIDINIWEYWLLFLVSYYLILIFIVLKLKKEKY